MIKKKTDHDQKQISDQQTNHGCKVVAFEDLLHQFMRIVRYVTASPDPEKRIEKPLRTDQRLKCCRVRLGLKMIDHIFGTVKCRLQLSEYRPVRPKKIKERNRQDQQQSGHKTHRKKNDLYVGNKFLVVG